MSDNLFVVIMVAIVACYAGLAASMFSMFSKWKAEMAEGSEFCRIMKPKTGQNCSPDVKSEFKEVK